MDEITKELLDALRDAEEALSHVENNLHVRVNPPTLGRMREAIAKAEAALAAPQPSDNGWIPWEGGDCPVETKGYDLFLRFRDGSERSDYVTRARGYDWKWERRGHPADIIAYRVVKP